MQGRSLASVRRDEAELRTVEGVDAGVVAHRHLQHAILAVEVGRRRHHGAGCWPWTRPTGLLRERMSGHQ